MHRDDIATLSAIAMLAMCVATISHEAIGHGGVCLAAGGDITRLTSVYFQCSVPNAWVAIGGPIGNLVAAGLAWLAWRGTPGQHARLRAFLLLVATFSLFWFSGNVIYSAALNTSDTYFFVRDMLGPPNPVMRLAAVVIGIVGYGIGLRMIRAADLAHASRVIAWIVASLAACAATFVYAPDRLGALTQAALEIGAASLPLAIARAGPATPSFILRSWLWIAAAIAAYAAFVATLGLGLP